MPEWIWAIAFLVGYLFLTQWLLPRWVCPPEEHQLRRVLARKSRTESLDEGPEGGRGSATIPREAREKAVSRKKGEPDTVLQERTMRSHRVV